MDSLISIKETAKIFAVNKRTVYKWLANESVFKKTDWIKTPGGDIRIKKSAIKKMIGENNKN